MANKRIKKKKLKKEKEIKEKIEERLEEKVKDESKSKIKMDDFEHINKEVLKLQPVEEEKKFERRLEAVEGPMNLSAPVMKEEIRKKYSVDDGYIVKYSAGKYKVSESPDIMASTESSLRENSLSEDIFAPKVHEDRIKRNLQEALPERKEDYESNFNPDFKAKKKHVIKYE